MSTMLERAISLAATMHAGQVDKAGAPYILHPLRVMLACEGDAQVAAVLHDVMEDCPAWSADRFREAGYPEEIVEALIALTRQKSETYDAFIERVALNPMARAVKVADLADNSDMRRLAHPTERDYQRLAKYERATARLTGKQMA